MEDKKTEDTGETERTLFPRKEDRRKWSALGGILLVLILLMAGVYFYAFDRVGLHGTAMVDVPRNSTGRDIADTLEKRASSGAVPCSGCIPGFWEAARACRAGPIR